MSRAENAIALLLCAASAGGIGWLIASSFQERAVSRPTVLTASAVERADDAFLGTISAPCPSDSCSLATLRAMIGAELHAAHTGEARASDPAVRGTAARIKVDFEEDEASLNSLEARLAVPESSCTESTRTAASLEATLAVDAGPSDRSFVGAQRAALDEMKRVLNSELIGCAANGDLKTTLRFARSRGGDGGSAVRAGIVADLAAVHALDQEPLSSRAPLSRAAETERPFVHPGILVTRPQLDFVKEKISRGAEPWKSAYARAREDAHGSVAYSPHPPRRSAATDSTPATEDGTVLCGSFSDPDVHCADEKDDSVGAYTQALLWYLGGDDRYAHNAIAILNAWSVLAEHRLFNAALQAAWTGTMFARAAELMQLSPLWSEADVESFKRMMGRAFLPRLLAARPGIAPAGDASYGQNGNWMLSVADSLIQIGVLLDDRQTFNRGIALWRDRVPAYCYLAALDGAHPHSPEGGYGGSNAGYANPPTRTGDPDGYWGQAGRSLPDGVSQETCRDLEHVQFGLAALTNGAETARIQGVDLYSEQAGRIAACMEEAALYESEAPTDGWGRALAYATPVSPAVTVRAQEASLCPNANGQAVVTLLNAGSLAAYAVQPTWEIGYNALVNRLGMNLPRTRELLMRYRSAAPGWTGATHHMGWETLTHGDVGSVGLPLLAGATPP